MTKWLSGIRRLLCLYCVDLILHGEEFLIMLLLSPSLVAVSWNSGEISARHRTFIFNTYTGLRKTRLSLWRFTERQCRVLLFVSFSVCQVWRVTRRSHFSCKGESFSRSAPRPGRSPATSDSWKTARRCGVNLRRPSRQTRRVSVVPAPRPACF